MDIEATMIKNGSNARPTIGSPRPSMRQDLEQLLRLQLSLIRCDIRDTWNSAAAPVVVLIGAAVTIASAEIVGLFGLGQWLAQWIDQPGLALIVVALVAAGLSLGAGALAYGRIRRSVCVMQRSRDELTMNLHAIVQALSRRADGNEQRN
jgi:Putative Actinobacterial Holin-X, holin superfamily III